MALPLVGAALAAAGRLLASKGAQAVIKKYGSSIAKQVKAHFDDFTKVKPNAANIKKMKPVQAANSNSRSTLRTGLGYGAGTVGTVAVANNIKMRGQVKRATEQGQNNTASSEAAKSVLKDDYAKLAGKMTPSEVARRKNSKPVNKNSSAQNSVAANRDRLAKTQAAEAKIQAELDRSARLGDKGPKQVEKTSKLAPKTSPRPKPRPKNK